MEPAQRFVRRAGFFVGYVGVWVGCGSGVELLLCGAGSCKAGYLLLTTPCRVVGAKKEKQSNKATLVLHSPSKSSFTTSKLRFLVLRAPKISTCYTTSHNKGLSTKLVGQPLLLIESVRFTTTPKSYGSRNPRG